MGVRLVASIPGHCPTHQSSFVRLTIKIIGVLMNVVPATDLLHPRLSDLPLGAKGIVKGIALQGGAHGIDAEELERRLLEIGFVEGAEFHILHEGLIGHDPIAIKLDDMRVALRRLEASVVLVEPAL